MLRRGGVERIRVFATRLEGFDGPIRLEVEGLPPGGATKAAIAIAGLLAYALLFEWLGFPLSTALATIVIGRLFGGEWKRLVVAGLALGRVLVEHLHDKLGTVLELRRAGEIYPAEKRA